MRVITGTARGHKLVAPEGLDTRPTTDRIKETLFNILSPSIWDCSFLDLFSGSGAIGIEALSRGAKEAVFVEQAPKALEAIGQNLSQTKLTERAEVKKMDVLAALALLGSQGRQFDLIFLDPPYQKGLYGPVLEAIVREKVLKEDGMIIAEHLSKETMPPIAGLTVSRVKNYGATAMTFLTLEEE